MTVTIDIYPPVKHRKWMKVGAICEVVGEGGTLFRVEQVGEYSLFLESLDGTSHGRESVQKCYRSRKAREAERGGTPRDFKRWWARLTDAQLTALLDTKPPGVLGPWDGTPTLLGRSRRSDHRSYEVVQVWYDDRSRVTPWRWHFEFESGQAETKAAAQKEADKALRKKGWRLRNKKS